MPKFSKLLVLGLICITKSAISAPPLCSYGYADSTCVPALVSVAQTPPTCSTDPGWTTAAPAPWLGHHYGNPQCIYTAPQPCPAGFDTISAATWNGSTWVGPQCQPATPIVQKPDLPTIAALCSASMASWLSTMPGNGISGKWGTWQGPTSESVPPQMMHGGYDFIGMYTGADNTYTGATDLYWASDMSNPGGAGGSTGSGGTAICTYETGTTTLLSVQYAYVASYDGG